MKIELIYNKNDEQLNKLLRSSFFDQLVGVLQEEVPTLRRLKALLGDKIDKRLDYLIDQGVVGRKDRRYFLAVKLVEPEQELVNKWSERLVSYFEGKEQSAVYSTLEQLLALESESEMYGIDADVDFCYRNTLSNGELSIHSLALKQKDHNLPSYFACMYHEEAAEFTEVEALIGDVAPDYYLDQVQVVIEKILKGRRKIRSSIFVESMRLFGLVEEGETLELIVPVIETPVEVPFLTEFSQLSNADRRFIISQTMQFMNLNSFTIVYLA